VKLYVEPGQTVAAGQSIAIVEAMKMQNKLVAEKDGKIKLVKAKSGDNVSLNQIIVEFEN
jgi:propionyl-CoA carboxylase alpha chain